MAEAMPTPNTVHDKLVEALTDYLTVTTGKTTVRATDYVVSVAGIDLSMADGRIFYATAYTGAPHARLGLVDILVNDVEQGVFIQE